MDHLPPLIIDLALVLGAAGLTTLLFRKLKQPLVLGYIIAGLLVSPQISIIPSVIDNGSVKIWAEIGVIFLLFNLGLEFSFKKLMTIGGTASITAFVEIIFIMVAGYFVGRWMGWSTIDSIFLGGLLASSSTTIILRAFDELNVKRKQFAQIVFGVLIVEDLVVILLMVLLPAIAAGHGSADFGSQSLQLGTTVLKLLFFLVIWFLLGIFLLPTFLRIARKYLDSETLLIVSAALCFGMVVLATRVGFSAELGAFIMGSIFAETTSAEKIEHVQKPVKDLFGAVFFVSVGMMIDLKAMWEFKWPILIVAALTIVGKLFSTTAGALISGRPLKQALQAGMSMAQIGEFAFIIATLGISLGVTSAFLFPVAVGASVITTFTTPYLIKFSEPFYYWIEKRLPKNVRKALDRYASSSQNIQSSSEWNALLKTYLSRFLVNGAVIIAIMLLLTNVLWPVLEGNIHLEAKVQQIIYVVVSLLLISPFAWAMMIRRPKTKAYEYMLSNSNGNKSQLIVLEITRLVLSLLFLGFIFEYILPEKKLLYYLLPVLILIIFLFSSRIQKFYGQIESRFMRNFNAREISAEQNNPFLSIQKTALSYWDAHITGFDVPPNAPYVGKALEDLRWREKYGINIAMIQRGERKIYAPTRYEKLFPYDKLSIIATDDQVKHFRPILESTEDTHQQDDSGDSIILVKLPVEKYTLLQNKKVRDCRLRELTHSLVVGIERGRQRILNPETSEVLKEGDLLWVVGSRRLLSEWMKENGTETAQ